MIMQSLESTDLKFLLSNPPHQDVDAASAASIFGVTAAEARMKLNFPGTEVWFVDEEGSDMVDRVTRLRDAGAKATVTSGRMIASLAERLDVRGFAFRDDVMELEVGRDQPVRLPYGWSVHAVVCRPMEKGEIGPRQTLRQAAKAARPNKSRRQEARTSISMIKAPVDDSFVDLYFTDGANVVRATMWPGRTEFSGLGENKNITERHNVEATLNMLAERFAVAYLDRRLENAPSQRITLLGRRTLRGHLEVVDVSLKDIDEHDLMSRLAFLAHAGA